MVQEESLQCRLCESLITESDQCTVLLDESLEQPTWSCPPVFHCGPIISVSYSELVNGLGRLALLQRVRKCYKFIMNTQNLTRYADFFSTYKPVFIPYSVIILLQNGLDEDEAYEFSREQTNFIYYNALHVIQLYQTPSRIKIKNVLTGSQSVGSRDMIPHISSVLPNIQLHPLIDSNFSVNEINISLFHRMPFTIDKRLDDLDTLNETSTLDAERFDGFEFQLMSHITRSWKRRFFVRNIGSKQLNSRRSLLRDIVENQTNMAMYGLWMYKDVNSILDVSRPYAQQCLTLIVPRLQPIPRDKYVYMAFEENIWIYYGLLLACIFCLVCFFVTIGENFNVSLQYELFSNAVVQVLAIATQHGITQFPPQNSAKVLFVAWFMFSFLLAAIYSTGHTSILTTSLFHKPINTIKDVVDRELAWGDTTNLLNVTFSRSENQELRQLVTLLINPDSDEAENLLQNFKYAQTVSIQDNRYVIEAERFENFSPGYRVMNTCLFKVHTVFAFKVNSPYVSFFNREIPKYIESGLIQRWMDMTSFRYGDKYVFTFFRETKEMTQEPSVMSVDDIAFGLYVLGGGLIIATVAFLLELCYFYLKPVK
ncbi:uncharacterized protein DMENIID0001_096400 [Sergentomyia squamirostris]